MVQMIKRHSSLLAYAIVAVGLTACLWLIQVNNDHDREREFNNNVAICQSNYDLRQTVIRFVDSQSQPIAPPPAATQEEITEIDRANQRSGELKRVTESLFGEAPCVKALGLVATSEGQLVPK